MGEKKKVKSVFYYIFIGIFGIWAALGAALVGVYGINWIITNDTIPMWIWVSIVITFFGGVLGFAIYKDKKQEE